MSDSPDEASKIVQPAENIRSGPIVVHVLDSTTTMATITPRSIKRRGRLDRLWIVCGLAMFVFLGMFWETDDDANVSVWTKSAAQSSVDRAGDSSLESVTSGGGSEATMDVDAPPIPRSSHSFDFSNLAKPLSKDDTPKDENNNKPSFSFLSWGQSYRFDKEMPSTSSKKTKRTKKTNKQSRGNQRAKQIPIIDDNDDHVPHAAAGAVLRAADALLCRDSVIDYVINATDLKDECDGLKKAYTKNCGGDEEEGAPAVGRRRLQQQQERLVESTTTRTIQRRKKQLIQWQKWIHQKSSHFYRYWTGRSQPEIFMIEDEILEEWDEATYEVQNNWDLDTTDDAFTPAMEVSSSITNRRILNQAEDFTRAETRLEKKELKAQQALEEEQQASESTPPPTEAVSPPTNKTSTSTKEKEKPKLSNLALPTNKHHVSEKMLSETLLLQQDEHIMAHVIAATTNTTTTAAGAEAAKNSKAVSDTLEFVSSVLNDPSSVEARTCCTSILNVFHENCSVDEGEELSDSRLFIVVAVIALCGMVKSLIRHFQIRWLPEAAGCILVGVGSGWALSHIPHHDMSFDGPWFLRIMVPPIVFEAALSIDKRSFNRHLVPILFYAIVGTLLSTGLTAFFVHEGSQFFQGSCETIPLIEALTFGALISSIDPIAVLSVLSNMGMNDTDTIYVVIFGESLLNDGVAIVLFQTLVHFLDDHMEVDSNAIAAATIHFLVVAVGSLLVGLASGICCTVYYWAMHGCQTALVEVLMFCCWALIPYYVCDGIEWSGIVAVVAAGFVMDIQVIGQHGYVAEDPLDMHLEQQTSPSRRRERRGRPIFLPEGHLSKEAKAHIGFVTEIIATMMETAIFAYLGLFLFSSRYHWNNYHTMIAILACCVSRAIMIPSLSTLANWITRIQQFRASCSRYQPLPQQQQQQQEQDDSFDQKQSGNPAGVIIDRKMQLVLWFAGLRGAMSFALVESIPIYDTVTGEGTRFKSELKAMTSACIMFTVFVLGGLTYYMMENLGMAPSHGKEAGSRHSLEKDMEMVGLLSASFSSKRGGEDSINISNGDDYNYEQDHHVTEIPLNTGPTTNSGRTFRQRAQAS